MEAVADWAAAVADAVETAVEESKSVAKQLSRSSSSDSDQMYSGGSPEEVLNSGGKAMAPTQETNIIFIPDVMDKTLIVDGNNSNSNSNSNNNNSTTPSTVSVANVGYQKLAQEYEQELYLQTLHKLPNFHKFYCPNCNSCLTKVIILRDGSPSLSVSIDRPTQLIGEVTEIPHSPRLNDDTQTAPDDLPISPPKKGGSIRCSNCFSFLAPIGDWISSQIGFGRGKPAISNEIAGADPTTLRTTRSVPPNIFPRPETSGSGSMVIPIPPNDDVPREQKVSRGKSLEIIKSVVYGGLTEAITSLGIVTSAASANTPTENIVALALANLITGLIVITNNLSGLKSNKVKKESNETNEPHVDPYEEALGDRENYLLHYTIAILSFLLFGLLPPLVYGFSFRDTDDADLKLAAVAVTSLLCIALLAIAKAYVLKQQTWKEFAKTIVYYISLGFGASGLSYLAGKEFNILLEQLGWFKKDPMAPTLLLPNMNYAKPTWGSI